MKAVTMAEIDLLRLAADDATEALRRTERFVAMADGHVYAEHVVEAARQKRLAEDAVVAALQQWWAQGCQPGVVEDVFGPEGGDRRFYRHAVSCPDPASCDYDCGGGWTDNPWEA